MVTVVFADVSGNRYSFRLLDLESCFNACLSVLEIDTGHGAEVSSSRDLDARNYQLIHWFRRRSHLEKLLFAYVVQNFPVYCRNRRFVSIFTAAWPWSLFVSEGCPQIPCPICPTSWLVVSLCVRPDLPNDEVLFLHQNSLDIFLTL